jgi:hypothetical protein
MIDPIALVPTVEKRKNMVSVKWAFFSTSSEEGAELCWELYWS